MPPSHDRAQLTRALAAFGVFGVAAIHGACGVDCADYDACGSFSMAAGGHDGGEGSGGSSGTSDSAGMGGASGAAEAGASGEAGTSPALPCDLRVEPGAERCEGEAIFVATNGDDAAAGTASAPLQTLAAALQRFTEAPRPILVCVGTYAENWILDGVRSVEVRGGFACDGGWAPTEGRSVVQPPAGVPLRVAGSVGVLLQQLEFRAAEADAPGASSIAAIVLASRDVQLEASRLEARDGVDGADGASAAANETGAAAGGLAAVGGTPGEGGECLCADGVTEGGIGGGAGAAVSSGAPGIPELGGGSGGLSTAACEAGGDGKAGASGTVTTRRRGAALHGTIQGGEFAPAPGEPGGDGARAQGGGGGRGGPRGAGGGGGCGGCGGAGGAPGEGGGSSIGLLSIDSTVTLADVAIQTGIGGDGGNGGRGAAGQSGGDGGLGADSACSGGRGGDGAPGQMGGGGAGGLSVGALYRGPSPAGRFQFLGSRGAGKGGNGDAMGRGLDGIVVNTLAL